uniref:Dromedarisin n=1 Tax=Hyalomma dromedarii TaxID=34626 RepID=A0A8E4MHR4_HYADR|nr:dromedarisin [Hyalomma dromedarii]
MRGLLALVAYIANCGRHSATALVTADGDTAHLRVRRGFGCPLDQGACHYHCRSIRRRGGYCSDIIKQTCTCYTN